MFCSAARFILFSSAPPGLRQRLAIEALFRAAPAILFDTSLRIKMPSVLPRELCATCKAIIGTISVTLWHKNLFHHQSLASLERSVEADCCICAEVLNQLRDRDSDSSDPLVALFPIECECDTSSASWQSSFELILASRTVASFSVRFIFEVIEKPTGE